MFASEARHRGQCSWSNTTSRSVGNRAVNSEDKHENTTEHLGSVEFGSYSIRSPKPVLSILNMTSLVKVQFARKVLRRQENAGYSPSSQIADIR